MAINTDKYYYNRAHNPKVVGSNPAPATHKNKHLETKNPKCFFLAEKMSPICHQDNSKLNNKKPATWAGLCYKNSD